MSCWELSISIVLSWKLVLAFFVMKKIVCLLSLWPSSRLGLVGIHVAVKQIPIVKQDCLF